MKRERYVQTEAAGEIVVYEKIVDHLGRLIRYEVLQWVDLDGTDKENIDAALTAKPRKYRKGGIRL